MRLPHNAGDCLIALLAIEHDLIMLHSDADFSRMAGVLKDLREISA